MPGSLNTPWSWGFVILISLLFQAGLPIVSDEAYFIAWGKDLAPGFYDHPPLPGWISYMLRQIGEALGLETHGILHRIFALTLGATSLVLVGARLKALGAKSSALIALALIPGYLVLFNLYLNDTLLAFTSLVFLLAVEHCYRTEKRVWLSVLTAGLAFSLVLLTKYNGAFVFLGIVLALTTWPAGRRFLVTRMLGVSLIAAVPFIWHLWWNYNQCSINLAFNFGFRKSGATGYGPLWLLLALVVMTGPVAFLAGFASWKNRALGEFGFFTRVFLGNLVVVFTISVWLRDFGVNWGAPLGFIGLLALAEQDRGDGFEKARKIGLVLSAALLLPLGGLMAGLKFDLLQAEDLVSAKKAHAADLHLDIASGALTDALRPLVAGKVMASMEYGIGAGFDNAGFAETAVLSRSVYGRNQDLMTDFRALDGRDFVLLPNSAKADTKLAARLFDSYKIISVKTPRQSYEVILGQGFDYDSYRLDWINPVISAYYEQSPIPYRACFMDRYR